MIRVSSIHSPAGHTVGPVISCVFLAFKIKNLFLTEVFEDLSNIYKTTFYLMNQQMDAAEHQW
jgi:hypothetical protein